jgi:hypothetical protein
MLKKVVIISMLSLFVVVALTSTKVLNVINIEESGRDASSFHDMSAIIYTISGLFLCVIAFWTYRIHIVAGIIPWGLGLTLFVYGLYLCWVKGIIAF